MNRVQACSCFFGFAISSIILSGGVAWNEAFAESFTAVCEAVKEKAWKAERVVAKRQRAVEMARNKTRLAQSQLVECHPGAVFSIGRAQRCAQAQSDVPRQVNVQVQVEDQLAIARTDLQDKQQRVVQECLTEGLSVTAHDVFVRISALEAELQELKSLLRQFDDE
ncbi:MAG: hypothetical protein NPIRA02_12540 [Nitrospirales bacterium]|nr:MAG: hypothetical protein NPIRA02_12540 [Nitrospirales bacterium]